MDSTATRAPVLCLFLALVPALAGAQPQQPSDRLQPAVRGEMARGNLSVGNLYHGVPSGLYWVVAMHSGKCMSVSQRHNGTTHIAAETCRFDGPGKGPLMAVIRERTKNPQLPAAPSQAFGFYPAFSLRPMLAGVEASTRCAQVADGVVLGAPGIDVTACKDVAGAEAPEVGVADACVFGDHPSQHFRLQRITGRDGYRIRTSLRSVPFGELPHTHGYNNCIDVREGSTADGAEHINFRCGAAGGTPPFNQVFRFIPAGPLPEGLERCVQR
jgi:hypothetical protein